MNPQLFERDYFELFGLERAYLLEREFLRNKYLQLQKTYHPDNFANQGSESLAEALQFSSLINQAHATLSNPLSRAIYLLELLGVKVDLVHDTKFTPEFLFAQIELREEISAAAAAEDFVQLEALEARIKQESARLETELNQAFQSNSLPSAVELLKQLAFYTKLEQLIINLY